DGGLDSLGGMCFRSEPSPDFKGIKTVPAEVRTVMILSEPSPDFKGIKTCAPTTWCRRPARPNQALISKGLRLFMITYPFRL
ncbi:hypothetical protein, partial [Tepidimonas sp.]|uniref:hypothetical protein n=1 Tax=Tepidimonas sp. TaxID=2002775 RepID=UPI0039188B1A